MAERIDAIIHSLIARTETEQSPLFGIQERWAAIAGEAAAYSKPVKLTRGRLVVLVQHPADSHAMQYQKQNMLKRIQESAASRVSEIVVKIGKF